MTSKKFRLDIKNNNPFQLKMNVAEAETHALIRLTKGAFCDSLNVLIVDNGILAPKNLPAKALNLLQLVNQPEFSVNANFSSAKGFIDIEVYKGKWEEILLAEVEFSFSDAPYNISCNAEQIDFTIGSEDGCRIEVKQRVEEGFDVLYTVVMTPEKIITIPHFFAEDDGASQIIRRLYGRIKGRVKGEGFEQRQLSYQIENTKNLNKIMLDSFIGTVN